jgi:hypothetical protein
MASKRSRLLPEIANRLKTAYMLVAIIADEMETSPDTIHRWRRCDDQMLTLPVPVALIREQLNISDNENIIEIYEVKTQNALA